MGLNQKQAVAILYSISAVLGLAAVLITTSGELKALIFILGFFLCAFLWAFVYGKLQKTALNPPEKKDSQGIPAVSAKAHELNASGGGQDAEVSDEKD